MQPHPPQLPTDSVADASSKHWRKPVLWIVLVVAVLGALIAIVLPKKQVEGQNAPTPSQHQAKSPGYNAPTH
jgi:hypothetical protein